MKNTKNGFLIALFIAIFTLTACSSCGDEQRATHRVDSSEGSGDAVEVGADTDVAEVVEEVEDGSGDVSEDTGEDADTLTVCSPSERSVCFLDSLYSSIAELELCGNGTLQLLDITPQDGPMVEAGATMYMCPGYQSENADDPIDVILLAVDGVVISASEAHTYDDLSDLVEANQVTMAMYASSCESAHNLILTDGFACEVDGRDVSVGITASSNNTDHVMIINFISDMNKFSELLELL